MSQPDSRRILLAAWSPPALGQALDGFQAIQGKGSVPAKFELRTHRNGWLELRCPVAMPTYAFHNLAVWLSAPPDVDTKPRSVVLLSEGTGDWGYWLVPGPDDAMLTGARANGVPFQVDVPSGRSVDDPTKRRAPMATELALVTLGVPRDMQAPLPGGPEASFELQIHPHDPPWSICEPGSYPPPQDDVPSGWGWFRRWWLGK